MLLRNKTPSECFKLYVSMYMQLCSMGATISSAFASRSSDSSVGFLCRIFGLFMPLAHGQLFGALQAAVPGGVQPAEG